MPHSTDEKSSTGNTPIAVLLDLDSLLTTDLECQTYFSNPIDSDDPNKKEQTIKEIKTRLRTHGILDMGLIDALLTKKISSIHLFTDKNICLGSGPRTLSYLDILIEVLQEKGLTVDRVILPADNAWHLKGSDLLECVRTYGSSLDEPIVYVKPEERSLIASRVNEDPSYQALARNASPPTDSKNIGITFSTRRDHIISPLTGNEDANSESKVRGATLFTRLRAYASGIQDMSVKVQLAEQFDKGWNAPLGKYIVFSGELAELDRQLFVSRRRNVGDGKTHAVSSYEGGRYGATFNFRLQEINEFSEWRSPRTDSPIDPVEEGKLKATINRVHAELLRITESYYSAKNSDPAKKQIFFHLQGILRGTAVQSYCRPPRTKLETILDFKNLLDAKDKDITLHRTPSWLRFIYEVVSALTLLPMCGRAIHSCCTYGTWKFWKPTSEKALLNIKKEVDSICESVLRF